MASKSQSEDRRARYIGILNLPAITRLCEKGKSKGVPSMVHDQKKLAVCAMWLALLVDSTEHIVKLRHLHVKSGLKDTISDVADELDSEYEKLVPDIVIPTVQGFAQNNDGLRTICFLDRVPFTMEEYFANEQEISGGFSRDDFDKQLDLLAVVVEDLAQKVKKDLAQKDIADPVLAKPKAKAD